MRVAVVVGGPSGEAEVSRVSGEQVATALRQTFADVRVFELSPTIAEELTTWHADVVFPALHGPPGEDGTFQGLLDILGLGYVGSGVRASACAMDKTLSKLMFRAVGLPLADDIVVSRHDDLDDACRRITAALGESVVVKPSAQGSALGVRFADDPEDLREALRDTFSLDDTVLVERRIVGREITVAVLEKGDDVLTSPVIEIVTPGDSWYDYEHRYTQGLSEHLIPARIPDATAEQVRDAARRAHQVLGCRDLSRVDFVVGENEIALLEVNTMPGMTPTSLYPDGAAALGVGFDKLMAHFVRRAADRGTSRDASGASA